MLAWLEQNIAGLENKKDCETYASDLLKELFIYPVITKKEFTNQCYYAFNYELIS